jgi:hypothetical protein
MSKQLYVFLEDGDLIMDGDVFVKWDGEDFQWCPTLLVGEHWRQGMNPVIRKVASGTMPEFPGWTASPEWMDSLSPEAKEMWEKYVASVTFEPNDQLKTAKEITPVTIGGILRDAITEIRKHFGVAIKRVEFITCQDKNGYERVVAVSDIKVEVAL